MLLFGNVLKSTLQAKDLAIVDIHRRVDGPDPQVLTRGIDKLELLVRGSAVRDALINTGADTTPLVRRVIVNGGNLFGGCAKGNLVYLIDPF